MYVGYPGEEIMGSENLLPSNNIKLESFSDNVQSSTGMIISEAQVCEKMNNKTPVSVKIEQPAVYVDYPVEEIMGSKSLLPSNNIKLESTGKIISEVQVFGKFGSKTSIKLEQPDVYVDYADEDMKMHVHEQSQMEKKMVFSNIDWKPVKHELSNILCHKKSKMVGMESCCSIPEITGNITESKMSEDMTLIHHQEVSFIGTEDGYIPSPQHEHCSYLSEAVTSKVYIDTKISLINENSQLRNVETPIKQTQISRMSLDDAPDYTYDSSQRTQAENTACTFDNFDININVDKCLPRHKITHVKKPYICDVCAASFTQSGSLKFHKRTHTGEKPYKCDVCAASFTQGSNLKSHKRTHTGEKPYKCAVCAASFTRADNHKRHMRTHTGEKPYKCDVCGASFTEAGNLKCHKRTHTGEKPYKCDVCAASFTEAGNLKCHKRTHTGMKPYKCDDCAATFTYVSSLKCHKRTHTGEEPYKCDVCAASFTGAGNLWHHRRTHTGEKPYKCDVCVASFTEAGNLKCHKRTHTGEKPYKCNVCAASFTYSRSLKCHKRTHTAERPYKCGVCTVSFTDSCSLKSYKRTHTGEKSYMCDLCAASFLEMIKLKYHIRTHTGEEQV